MISFVGSSNVSNGLAQGTSAVVPKPGGVVNGDFLLAFVSIGNTAAITAPAGWVEVSLGTNTAPNLQNRIYSKVASGEPASWTWTFTSAAYVGICHATRGVSHVYAANQTDDSLSLLAHTTPVVAAPANGWLVSSWTGRNLLALGWSPPSLDLERQDVIGGLLILLNVNHAVDDTNGPVAAGSYSKTTNTLISIRALDALVALAPTLDPIVGTALDLKGLVSAPVVGLGVVGAPLDAKAVLAPGVLGLGVLGSALDGRASVASATASLGMVAAPIDLKALIVPPIVGPAGLVGTPLESVHLHTSGTLIPGEVFIGGTPMDLKSPVAQPVITPGNVNFGGVPLLLTASIPAPVLTPGEVTLFAEPIPAALAITEDGMIVLGYLISNEDPLTLKFDHPGFLLGLTIGSNVGPFIVPPPNTATTYLRFPNRPMGPVVYGTVEHGGVCCP